MILSCTVSEDGEDEEEEYEEEEQVPLPDGTMPPPKKRKRKAKKGRRSKLSNKKQDFQVSSLLCSTLLFVWRSLAAARGKMQLSNFALSLEW